MIGFYEHATCCPTPQDGDSVWRIKQLNLSSKTIKKNMKCTLYSREELLDFVSILSMTEYSKPEFIHNNTRLHLLSFCGDPGTVLATVLVQVNLIFTRMKYFFVIFTDKKNERQRDYIMIHPKAPHCIRIQTQAAGYQN